MKALEAADSLCGEIATRGEGRGEEVDADATEMLTAPPDTKTSLRRAGECTAPELTIEAGAEVGRSGDTGRLITVCVFLGDVGDATGGLWLSDGVVALSKQW